MPTLELDDIHHLLPERDRVLHETSSEQFDRGAFAMHALDLLRPAGLTVAVCEGSCLRLETGRTWGTPVGERWAVLAIPPDASRRSIAVAVAALARLPGPYVLDLLFAAA
jgi:hypothetical protein